tara:strand:- start:1157 stop:1471 length:315 start_codon:yes stop_codon:yes gene_type:complete
MTNTATPDPDNLDEQFILLDALMEPPSVEQELELEKKIRWFKEGATHDQLLRHCEAVERYNFQQSQFIANCLTEIAKCKAKIACLENPVRQPTFKNFLRKIFDL